MAVAVGLAFIIIRPGADPTRAPAVAVSTTTEAFVLPRLAGGGAVRLADFRGQPTVVTFFSSGCLPCQGELTDFGRVAKELKGKVHFVFIDSMETGDGLAMAQRFGVGAMPIARDSGARGSALHDAVVGSPSMPATALYDPAGKLRVVIPGAIGQQVLREMLHDL